MTEVAFHFNLADKLAYGCRLLRKIYERGGKAVVLGEPEQVGRMDHLLWTFSAGDFLAHCRGDASADMLDASPIVLTEQLGSLRLDLRQTAVLVNLSRELPAGFEKFERLFELVEQNEDDALPARQRWKFYKDRGYAIERHDQAGAR